MKRFTNLFLICVSLAIAPMLVTGCKTADLRLFQVSSGVHITAKQGLQLLDKEVASGNVSVEQQKEVRNAYRGYQKAQIALLRSVKAHLAATQDGAGTDATQAKIDNAAREATLAFDKFLDLLQQYGVKGVK